MLCFSYYFFNVGYKEAKGGPPTLFLHLRYNQLASVLFLVAGSLTIVFVKSEVQ